MNLIDIIIGIFLLVAIWKGYRRGLIIEVASLAALVLGIYLAVHFSGIAEQLLERNFDLGGRYLRIISFILTFLLVVILVMILGKALEKLVNLMMLGLVNRIFGAVFSAAKTAVLLSVLVFLLNIFDQHGKVIPEKHKEKSKLYEPLAGIAPFIFRTLGLEDALKGFRGTLPEREVGQQEGSTSV